MTDREDIDEQRHQRRRASDQPAPLKTLGQAVIALSIAGSLITAGYNWRSVAILEAEKGDYVRKDVQQQQLNMLTYQLGEVSRQVEEVRVELRAQRRKGVE
jgi:hypothetical protein